MRSVIVCHLGRVEYAAAWELQKRVQGRLIEARRDGVADSLPHVLLYVEHPPVYTLGKSGDAAHLLLTEQALAARGATFHRVDRGGDITYHGPGQIVGYPILDLNRFYTDIHRYLRELEEMIILCCADLGIVAGRVAGRTGVWVGPDARGFERKICAMGIRCSRWVTMHGFALNVATDLDFFSAIVPCGITDRGVTSISAELGRPMEVADVQSRLSTHFSALFEADLSYLDGPEARRFLAGFIESDEVLTALSG
jgi:lipoyl(octanoyl) transferase